MSRPAANRVLDPEYRNKLQLEDGLCLGGVLIMKEVHLEGGNIRTAYQVTGSK